VCVWKPETDVSSFSQSFYTLFFETGFHTEHGACQFIRLACQQAPRILQSPQLPPPPVLEFTTVHCCVLSLCGCEIQAQVFILGQQYFTE
jgi:hypothetical protein